MTTNGPHVVIVGAGVVGLCCASHLQQRGYRVTLIDPRPPDVATWRIEALPGVVQSRVSTSQITLTIPSAAAAAAVEEGR